VKGGRGSEEQAEASPTGNATKGGWRRKKAISVAGWWVGMRFPAADQDGRAHARSQLHTRSAVHRVCGACGARVGVRACVRASGRAGVAR